MHFLTPAHHGLVMICGCTLYFGLQAPAEALLFLLPLGFGTVECGREQLEDCGCELNPVAVTLSFCLCAVSTGCCDRNRSVVSRFTESGSTQRWPGLLAHA